MLRINYAWPLGQIDPADVEDYPYLRKQDLFYVWPSRKGIGRVGASKDRLVARCPSILNSAERGRQRYWHWSEEGS